MTTVCPPQVEHPSGDRALGRLANIAGPLGAFVGSFPGKANSDRSLTWLDEWFKRRVTLFFADPTVDVSNFVEIGDLSQALRRDQDSIVVRSTRLVGIQLHYFRGFREMPAPIDVSSDLVVIDGRNSSGKTSLAEGIEWLFTGALSRRTMQELGNARELENCVSNQFKPDSGETWVEARFVLDGGEGVTLRRTLHCDYGSTQTSSCQSTLLLNGRELSHQEEEQLLDGLFGGIAPILMQHTLRTFIYSSPSDRHLYFERLLRLDELTFLIEKAVIGNSRLVDFPSSTGSVDSRRWESLKASVRQTVSKTVMRRVERDNTPESRTNVGDALASVAMSEFAGIVRADASLQTAQQSVSEEQMRVRQGSFPLLGRLRPRRLIDQQLLSLFDIDSLREAAHQIELSYHTFALAQSASSRINDSQIVIAQALELLEKSGLIATTLEIQTCPLCDYEDTPTLTPERITSVKSWQPIQQAVDRARAPLIQASTDLRNRLQQLLDGRRGLIQEQPTDQQWDEAVRGIGRPLAEAALTTRGVLGTAIRIVERFDVSIQQLLGVLDRPIDESTLHQIQRMIAELAPELDKVVGASRSFTAAVAGLETAVGSIAREDADYSLRDLWLAVVNNLENTVNDLRWEQAKGKAQSELEGIRSTLIRARQELLEADRVCFSNGMTSVWKALRADQYSTFSQLYIPEPRGRGFPIEIEVKATLDDGSKQIEVDALRVFSESQTNVLGIAAFATRSKLVGHHLLIFDDPVQSMDEEHFKTLASGLMKQLLDEGFQVIVLTHNDTFAREMSYAHIDLAGYVTMSIQCSRRNVDYVLKLTHFSA